MNKIKIIIFPILFVLTVSLVTAVTLLITWHPGQFFRYQKDFFKSGKQIGIFSTRQEDYLLEMKSELRQINSMYKTLTGPTQWQEKAVASEIASAAQSGIVLDENLRLISAPGKKEVPCPLQNKKTAVLFIFGQSNSSNFHKKKYQSEFGDKIINYINGKCYIAASPLLGGHGVTGESSTLLANKLLKKKMFNQIVLVSTAFGGTSVTLWQQGERFNMALQKSLEDVSRHYKITHMVWQNGEADAAGHRTAAEYKAAFYSMLSTIRRKSITAPIFIAVGTKCNVPNTPVPNPTSDALRSLPNKAEGLYAGVDTDKYITSADRFDDCHFNQRGQEKYSDLLVQVLQNYQKQKQN